MDLELKSIVCFLRVLFMFAFLAYLLLLGVCLCPQATTESLADSLCIDSEIMIVKQKIQYNNILICQNGRQQCKLKAHQYTAIPTYGRGGGGAFQLIIYAYPCHKTL